MMLRLSSKHCRMAQNLAAAPSLVASSSPTSGSHQACDQRSTQRRFKSTRPATMERLETSSAPMTFKVSHSSPAASAPSPQEAVTFPLMSTAPPQQQQQQQQQQVLVEEDDTRCRTQPASMTYTGDANIPVTSNLHIVTPMEDVPRGIWPVFRMMDEDGCFRDPRLDGVEEGATIALGEGGGEDAAAKFAGPAFASHLKSVYPQYAHEFDESTLLQPAVQDKTSFTGSAELEEQLPLVLRAHRFMVRLREMDKILLNAQRQGRISFYMTATGEEAIHMGATSALDLKDPVFAQYREHGVLMWRGFTLEQFTNQCFSNDRDLGKGRQMPVHYGSRALNYHTVSSPLGTQIPQAAGAAYRLKLAKQDNVVICFFGDGCSSTTDFHSGLNFAATLQAPVLFFCRNNGYAISTPVTDQYAGDGVVGRAPGYGMAAIRVDGNDVFAVHAAVREARKYALEHSAPVLIEAMTYRQGHHSTSDDSSRYRETSEVARFADDHDPVTRLEAFLVQHGWLTEQEAERLRENERLAVLQAMEQAEQRPSPPLAELFTDVYADLPPHLQEQQEQLKQHMKKYPEKYAA